MGKTVSKIASIGLAPVTGGASLLLPGADNPFAPPKIPKPAPPPPVVTPTEEPVKQLQAEEEKKRKIVGGRASTILTSPLGVTGEPTVSRKTLLGQ